MSEAAEPPLTRRQRERLRERWTGCKAADLSEDELARAWAAGYEPGPDGWMVGRDPRTMTQAELRAMGHEPMSYGEALRAKCLDCCAGSPHEVRLCVAVSCPNWDFRMGPSPWKAPRRLTEEQRAAASERMRAVRRRGSSEPG